MNDIERLIQALAKLPGLGPRSARRAVLHMLKRKETVLTPLTAGNDDAADAHPPLSRSAAISTPATRAASAGTTVATTRCSASSRTSPTSGRWSGPAASGATIMSWAVPCRRLGGVGPDDLRIPELVTRAGDSRVREVILAVSYTVEGQTTAHYIGERLADAGVAISGIAHGVPLGGELHYLDDATLITALRGRQALGR